MKTLTAITLSLLIVFGIIFTILLTGFAVHRLLGTEQTLGSVTFCMAFGCIWHQCYLAAKRVMDEDKEPKKG